MDGTDFETKYQQCCKPTGTIRKREKKLWGNLIIKFKIAIKFIDSKLKKFTIFKKAFLGKLYPESWAHSSKLITKITERIKVAGRGITLGLFGWVMYSQR